MTDRHETQPAICIVIFGDSYSLSAECDVDEDERPNGQTWVDYIPDYLDIRTESIRSFALPGATAEEDLDEQLARFSNLGQSQDTIALSSATYVFFLGINDCGQNTADRLAPIVDKIIEAARSLVTQFEGRNFVFVDVPPTDRAPAAVRMECGDTVCGRVNAWNDHLRAKVAEWAAEVHTRAEEIQSMSEETHSRAKETQSRAGNTQSRAEETLSRATEGTHAKTAEPHEKTHLFSSHEVITDILDYPEKYGFSKEDVAKEGGEIWVDDLHLSSAVHRILAERLVKLIELPTRSE